MHCHSLYFTWISLMKTVFLKSWFVKEMIFGIYWSLSISDLNFLVWKFKKCLKESQRQALTSQNCRRSYQLISKQLPLIWWPKVTNTPWSNSIFIFYSADMYLIHFLGWYYINWFVVFFLKLLWQFLFLLLERLAGYPAELPKINFDAYRKQLKNPAAIDALEKGVRFINFTLITIYMNLKCSKFLMYSF